MGVKETRRSQKQHLRSGAAQSKQSLVRKIPLSGLITKNEPLSPPKNKNLLAFNTWNGSKIKSANISLAHLFYLGNPAYSGIYRYKVFFFL